VVYGSREACRCLASRGGALINLGSILSDRAVPHQGLYAASKHAIKGWTEALRVELMAAHAPISVTLVKPAAIATPYAEHARNYFADEPTHPPPVYSPEAVARAILHAAEHPTREVTVGSAGVLFTTVARLLPRLTDTLMARLLVPAMHSGRPRAGRSTLFDPTEDLRVRGDYPGFVRPSVYTAAVRRPRTTSLLAAGVTAATLLALAAARRRTLGGPGTNGRQRDARAGSGTAAVQSWTSGGSARPNTRRSTTRAHQ
jgi:hypothetical protein